MTPFGDKVLEDHVCKGCCCGHLWKTQSVMHCIFHHSLSYVIIGYLILVSIIEYLLCARHFVSSEILLMHRTTRGGSHYSCFHR